MSVCFNDIWDNDKKVKKEAEEIKIKAVRIKEIGNNLVDFSDSIISEVNRREPLFKSLQRIDTNPSYLSSTVNAVSGSMMEGLTDVNDKLNKYTEMLEELCKKFERVSLTKKPKRDLNDR